MSLRDQPDSHKIIVPLVAGLAVVRAYDPASGGIGGAGHTRLSLPEKWINTPGTNPGCSADGATDRDLELWLDASDPATLTLGPEETDDDGNPIQQSVLEWRDKSGKNRHAIPEVGYTPKLARLQPFFPTAVDFTLPCAIADLPEEEV